MTNQRKLYVRTEFGFRQVTITESTNVGWGSAPAPSDILSESHDELAVRLDDDERTGPLYAYLDTQWRQLFTCRMVRFSEEWLARRVERRVEHEQLARDVRAHNDAMAIAERDQKERALSIGFYARAVDKFSAFELGFFLLALSGGGVWVWLSWM